MNSFPLSLGEDIYLCYFEKWKNFPLEAGFSYKRIDFSKEENLVNLCHRLGIERNMLVLSQQEHGSNIEIVSLENRERKFFCDALITKVSGLALGVLTADCLPIFLYDPSNHTAGIIHAGWRSTRKGIVKNCIRKMEENFFTLPSELRVAFGPGIGKCCYTVKEDLRFYFPDHIERRANQFFLDLKGVNLEQILSTGVRKENIIDSGICSSCKNAYFFSYRQEGNSVGRTISIIMLK